MKVNISTPLLLGFFLYASSLFGMAQAQTSNHENTATQTPQLYSLINQRLGLMREVAAFKWIKALPIEDLAREEIVIGKSVAQAQKLGLEPKAVTAFFQQQIYLAKLLQTGFHQQWQQGDPKVDPSNEEPQPDLAKTREKLIVLGAKIIEELAIEEANYKFAEFKNAITQPFVEEQDKALLFKTITAINPQDYPSRLDKILSEGILVIGTTGDYAPFSYSGDASETPNRALATFENSAVGIDIDLGKHLAKTLDVYPLFLKTSWPTLLEDLSSDEFDILMSGISKKLFRQRHGFFSKSYHEGGKTPIARCDQAKKFHSLEAIDQPHVSAIVNPGGTNERFLKQHVKQAKVLLHNDNRTIFQRIVDGDADLMITDKIEVQLKAAQFESLCGTLNGETFDYSAKAYLLPRDLVWLEYVNTWLEQAEKENRISKTFSIHLSK